MRQAASLLPILVAAAMLQRAHSQNMQCCEGRLQHSFKAFGHGALLAVEWLGRKAYI